VGGSAPVFFRKGAVTGRGIRIGSTLRHVIIVLAPLLVLAVLVWQAPYAPPFPPVILAAVLVFGLAVLAVRWLAVNAWRIVRGRKLIGFFDFLDES
jgi:hypothetical protein